MRTICRAFTVAAAPRCPAAFGLSIWRFHVTVKIDEAKYSTGHRFSLSRANTHCHARVQNKGTNSVSLIDRPYCRSQSRIVLPSGTGRVPHGNNRLTRSEPVHKRPIARVSFHFFISDPSIRLKRVMLGAAAAGRGPHARRPPPSFPLALGSATRTQP